MGSMVASSYCWLSEYTEKSYRMNYAWITAQ